MFRKEHSPQIISENNPEIAATIDRRTEAEYSLPVHTPDGNRSFVLAKRAKGRVLGISSIQGIKRFEVSLLTHDQKGQVYLKEPLGHKWSGSAEFAADLKADKINRKNRRRTIIP